MVITIPCSPQLVCRKHNLLIQNRSKSRQTTYQYHDNNNDCCKQPRPFFHNYDLHFFPIQTEQVKPVQPDAQATGLHAFATPALQSMGLTPSVRFGWTLSGTAESGLYDQPFSSRMALTVLSTSYIKSTKTGSGNDKLQKNPVILQFFALDVPPAAISLPMLNSQHMRRTILFFGSLRKRRQSHRSTIAANRMSFEIAFFLLDPMVFGNYPMAHKPERLRQMQRTRIVVRATGLSQCSI